MTTSAAVPSAETSQDGNRANALPATAHSNNRAIDGLRAVAIIAVMAVHAGVPGASVGWLGVDLFFVLSGFLITTLLVAEQRRTGEIKLGRFWLRRFLRLMPAYWLYAAAITVMFSVLHLGWRGNHGGFTPNHYLAGIWLYFINLIPQGGIWEFQSLTVHLWSLAVEEQFYLVWPLVCFLLARSGKLEPAAWIISALSLASLTLNSGGNAIARLDTRGFAITLGCAVALRLANGDKFKRWVATPRPWILVAIGVAFGCVTVANQFHWLTEEEQHRFMAPVLAVGFAFVIAHLWLRPESRLGKLLSTPAAVYIGKISYGLYLYHMAAHYLTWHVLLASIEDWNQWPKFFVRWISFCALTLAIAAASYHGWEQRFLALKGRFR